MSLAAIAGTPSRWDDGVVGNGICPSMRDAEKHTAFSDRAFAKTGSSSMNEERKMRFARMESVSSKQEQISRLSPANPANPLESTQLGAGGTRKCD